MPIRKPLVLTVALSLIAGGAGHAFDQGAFDGGAFDGGAFEESASASFHAFAPIGRSDESPRMVDATDIASMWRVARDLARRGEHSDAYRTYHEIVAVHEGHALGHREAAYVGGAMRELGRYHLAGSDDAQIESDPRLAEMHLYRSATLFGDADAQFLLGRFHLSERWGAPRRRYAARWLSLAARKGHRSAQIELARLLLKGEGVARDTSRGLMLLARAARTAKPNELRIVRELTAASYTAVPMSQRARVDEALRRANLLDARLATSR